MGLNGGRDAKGRRDANGGRDLKGTQRKEGMQRDAKGGGKVRFVPLDLSYMYHT